MFFRVADFLAERFFFAADFFDALFAAAFFFFAELEISFAGRLRTKAMLRLYKKTDAAEHLLFSDARLIFEELPQAVSQSLVIGHDRPSLRHTAYPMHRIRTDVIPAVPHPLNFSRGRDNRGSIFGMREDSK